jgi:hypothetical protein
MTDETEIVVSIDETTAVTEADKLNGAGTPAEDPVKVLKGQYAELESQAETDRNERLAAERRASDAERRAADATREAEEARTRVNDSEIETISSGLEAAKTAADAAQAEYERAFEAGDVKIMGTAQRRMARAEADIARLEEAKSTLDVRKTEKKAEPKPAADDPAEAWIASKAPEAQTWLRKNREYVTDVKKNAKLNAAHYDAVADGIEINSTEYFDRIEKFLGLKTTKDSNGRDHKPDGKFAAKRATPPSAPVNGASSAGGAQSATEVRLSKGEAMAATDGTHTWSYDDTSGQKRFKKGDPIGVQEFAKRKLAMQKQGLYEKSYTES